MPAKSSSYTVYMHTAPNGKKYIGITCQSLAKRWGPEGFGYRECTRFWYAIKKHGWGNIVHAVIAEGLPEESAKTLEKMLIAAHHTRDPLFGYNLTDGGDGMSGYRHPPEAKEKIRRANTGKLVTAETRTKIAAAGRGRVFSDAARANMGASHIGAVASAEKKAKMSAALIGNKNSLGKKHSYETRMKQSDALTGRVFTEETREKMRAAKAGKHSNFQGCKHTEEAKARIREARNGGILGIECLSMDGIVIGLYSTSVKAEEATGIKNSSIRRACSGKSKSSGGFKWRYLCRPEMKGTPP